MRWYTDDGYSGANFQRPGFQAMLADIEAGKDVYKRQRLYSGTLRLRDTVALAGREKLKITEMRIPCLLYTSRCV